MEAKRARVVASGVFFRGDDEVRLWQVGVYPARAGVVFASAFLPAVLGGVVNVDLHPLNLEGQVRPDVRHALRVFPVVVKHLVLSVACNGMIGERLNKVLTHIEWRSTIRHVATSRGRKPLGRVQRRGGGSFMSIAQDVVRASYCGYFSICAALLMSCRC
jgi:hypothetical protein